MYSLMDCKFEIKDISEDGTFQGYANVFNILDSGMDIVSPGAFSKSLKASYKSGTLPKMLWQHDRDKPIGVWTTMKEDDVGLYAEGKLVQEVQLAKEAYALMKARALDGLSIGYIPVKWKYDNSTDIRTLTEIDLKEVSVVTFPMNTASRITGVKMCDMISTIREYEDFLRDVGGFSAAQAKALASGGFKAIESGTHRDDASASWVKALQQNLNHLKGA